MGVPAKDAGEVSEKLRTFWDSGTGLYMQLPGRCLKGLKELYARQGTRPGQRHAFPVLEKDLAEHAPNPFLTAGRIPAGRGDILSVDGCLKEGAFSMAVFDPLNILLVVPPEVGSTDKYEDIVKQRFPQEIANGAIWIRKSTSGTGIPDEFLDTHIIGTGTVIPRVPEMKDLQWIMSFTSGVDHWQKFGKVPKHVSLTNLPGGSAVPVAEFTIGLMLTLAKNYNRLWDKQKERAYTRIYGGELYGKTLGLIGLGGIGREVAKRAKNFEMRIIGTATRKIDVPFVDEVYLAGQMEDVIKQSDFLVLACPETKDTLGMMNEERFGLMKKTAYLINCARGSLVVREALMKALNEGWIAGAAQDTWWIKNPVPSYLPPEDGVWDTKNLIITPHVSGFTNMYEERFGAVFAENIARFLKGEPLIHVVPGFGTGRS